jgi:hypothetical protein
VAGPSAVRPARAAAARGAASLRRRPERPRPAGRRWTR